MYRTPLSSWLARSQSAVRNAVAVFSFIFVIVGGATLYSLGIRPIARTIDARNWLPTPCKVLRAEIRDHDTEDGTSYSVHILYQYELKGQTYTCDRYDFVGIPSSGYDRKVCVVQQYQAAANPICYVNPRDPSEAVLTRGFQANLLVGLLPLPFLAAGIGGVLGSLPPKRQA
jgi:hypothetical protein